MANSAQATKRARQIKKRTLHNASQRSGMRTAIKATLKAIKDDGKEAASKICKRTFNLIDKVAAHGVIHKNKAARLKSRISKKLKAVAK